MSKFWPNGIGETLGARLVTEQHLWTTGTVYFVNSATGSDSNTGLGQDTAFLSLAHAVGVVAAQDTIVLMNGHTEDIFGTLTISANGVAIVGSGKSGAFPTVKLRNNVAGNTVGINFTGLGTRIENVWFQANAQSNTSPTVKLAGGSDYVRDCYFELAANDKGGGVSIAANDTYIFSSTFISTATSTATQPQAGVVITGALSDIWLSGVIADGGPFGFVDYGIKLNQTITRFRGESISLLRGADMIVGSASVGIMTVPTTTGGARVEW